MTDPTVESVEAAIRAAVNEHIVDTLEETPEGRAKSQVIASVLVALDTALGHLPVEPRVKIWPKP